MVRLLFSSRPSQTDAFLRIMHEIWLLWAESAHNGWTVYDDTYIYVYCQTKITSCRHFFAERQAPAYSLRTKSHNKALIDKTADLNERNFLIHVLLLTFKAVWYVCIYFIVLSNFNHRMYMCTWFAADEPFIKRRCYVRSDGYDGVENVRILYVSTATL